MAEKKKIKGMVPQTRRKMEIRPQPVHYMVDRAGKPNTAQEKERRTQSE